MEKGGLAKENNPTDEAVVRDGKFTVSVTGFLAIFDVFISQNRLDVPWRVLRKFGYDVNVTMNFISMCHLRSVCRPAMISDGN